MECTWTRSRTRISTPSTIETTPTAWVNRYAFMPARPTASPGRRPLFLEEALNLFGADCGRANRFQAELSVDSRSCRVIDPADDLLHTELVLRELGRHDVGAIGVGHRHEGFCPVGAGPAQDILVDRRAKDHLTGKVLSQAIEGGLAEVHDGHLITLFTQLPGEARTDSAAAHDHRTHSRS